MPGSTHISESPYQHLGNSLVNTLHIDETIVSSENPPACEDSCIFSPEANARRRVRSSGMIVVWWYLLYVASASYSTTGDTYISRYL